MPSQGNTCILTFNLINVCAESVNRSHALFWLTAKVQGPRTGVTSGFFYQFWTVLQAIGRRARVQIVFQLPFSKTKVLSSNFIENDIKDVA